MLKDVLKFIILITNFTACTSCKEISMEPVSLKLKLKNNSEKKIEVLINIQYPDSSLKNSFIDKYLNAHEEDYIGHMWKLDKAEGLTVFLFDYGYYERRWNDTVGTPDTFLEEDKKLKKFIFTKAELDSMKWEFVYE